MTRCSGHLPQRGQERTQAINKAASHRTASIDGCLPLCGGERARRWAEIFFGGRDLLLLLLDRIDGGGGGEGGEMETLDSLVFFQSWVTTWTRERYLRQMACV